MNLPICSRCHRVKSCPTCNENLSHPLQCHVGLGFHTQHLCPGERRAPLALITAAYRAEDFVTTGAPRLVAGARRKYHWENFVGKGWQERIPDVDFTVGVSAFRTAATNYARSHQLYFEWQMRGDVFAFRMSITPFETKVS
jgi:hypothetical protein